MGTDFTFQFIAAGDYSFKVTSGGNDFVEQGANYQLAVYLPGIPSNVAFTGDFGLSELPETTEPNGDIQSAQNLDLGRWNTNVDQNIALSDVIPHITVTGSGDGSDDFFSFEVTQEMITAGGVDGVQVILDLDNSFDFGDQIFWAGRLILFDEAGNVVRAGFGVSDPSLGGGPGDDSFFNDYVDIQLTQAGTYYISVSDAVRNNGLPEGVTYELNVSIEAHEEDTFVFVPEPLVENENGNNGFIVDPNTGNVTSINLPNAQQLNNPRNLAQLDDDGKFFFTFDDNAVGNTDFGGSISSSTPYARILGTGDGSYDVYSFTVSDELLNPPAIIGSVSDGATAADGTFFTNLTLGIAGSAEEGDVWTLGLRHRTYTVTVGTTTLTNGSVVDSIEEIADSFLEQLPGRFSASTKNVVSASDVRLSLVDPSGFNLVGANGEASGLEQNIVSSGSVSATTTLKNGANNAQILRVDIDFDGTPVAGERLTINFGAESEFVDVSATDTIETVVDKFVTAFGATIASKEGDRLRLTSSTAVELSFTSSGDRTGLYIEVENVRADFTVADADTALYSSLEIEIENPVAPGQEWSLTLNGTTQTFTSAGTSRTDVATGLQGLFTIAGMTRDGRKLEFSEPVTFGGISVTPAGSATVSTPATHNSQVATITNAGSTDDWVVRILESGTEVGRAEVSAGATNAETAEALADALTAESLSDYLFTHDGNKLVAVSTDSTTFSFVLTRVQSDITVVDGLRRDYEITQTPAANGEVWELKIDGPGMSGDVIATATSAATNILDDLVAGDVGGDDYRLIRGSGNNIFAINLAGDTFELELVIDAAAAIDLTDGTEEAVRILSHTGAVPTAAWNLEVKDDTSASGEFTTVVGGGGATLADRWTALAAGTLADFTFTTLGTTELMVTRSDNTDFDVRVTRERPAGAPADVTGTVSIITLAADSVSANTLWISTQDATSTEYTPADDAPIADVAEGVADDINDFTDISAISDGAEVVVIKTLVTAVDPVVTVAFATPAPEFFTYDGDAELEYEQTVTLEPAVSGDNDVTPGDRWKIDFASGTDASFTASSATTLFNVADQLADDLPAGHSPDSPGVNITFSRGFGNGIRGIDGISQRNRIVEDTGAGGTAPQLAGGDFYTTTNVTLAGNWQVGTVWTVTIDGSDYVYTVAQETDRDDNLATVAFKLSEAINAGLPGAPAGLLKATASGNTLNVTKRGTGAAVPDEPFTFGISRSTGTLEVLIDLDETRSLSGTEFFTTFREIVLFTSIFGDVTTTVPVQDSISFTATPTVSLYRVGDVGSDGSTGVPSLVAVETVRNGADQGSSNLNDIFNEYLLSQAGEYAVVIGSQITYNNFSNVNGVPRPVQFQNGVSGVARGQSYSAVVSIPGQVTNQDAITLAGTRLDIVEGTGAGQSGVIIDYLPEDRLYIVSPVNDVDWTVAPDNTSFFNISETVAPANYNNNIVRDEYTVVLSGAPVHADGVTSPTVTIDILPERTRTYNSDEAFNPVVYYGEQQERQVRVATQQAIIRSVEPINGTWNVTLTKIGGADEVASGATLADLATDIERYGYTATVTGDQILITNTVAFFTALDTGAAVANYNGDRAEIELSGLVQTDQTWTLELDGRNPNTSITGKTLEFKIVNRIGDRADLGRWIENGNTFTYSVLANSGPRISGIAEAFRLIIDDNPFFSDYSAERFGRILRLENGNGLNLDVSVDGSAEFVIMPTRAEVVQQLVFTDSNWSQRQTVTVEALDDSFVDGGDALVFAPLEERINTVRGPLTINGGFGQTDERFLNNPVMYPGETNEPLADGSIETLGSEVISELITATDNGRRAFIEDILATHRSASTGLRPGFDPRMNDFPYTVEFLDGRAEGAVYRVLPDLGVSRDIFSIGNSEGLTAVVSAGLLGTYFDARVTSTQVNTIITTGITWKTLNYTFSGSADKDETWTLTLPDAAGSGTTTYTATLGDTHSGTEINTLGRAVFALQDKINTDGIYNADVRIGLLGEISLILSRQDGNSFKGAINRSGGVPFSTPIDDTVIEGGFIDGSVALPATSEFTMVAYFANLDADFSALAGQSFNVDLSYRDQSNTPGVAGPSITVPTITVALGADPTLDDVLDSLVAKLSDAGLGEILAPAVSGRRVTFDSDWLVEQETGRNLRPLIGNEYYYAPFNANFAVDETDQVDVINLYNGDSPSNDAGVLTGDRLTGFGIGGDSVIGGREIEGGIRYVSLEEFNFEMGSGNDSLVIEGTHAGKTTINTGSGDDRVAISETSGTLVIEGDDGDDTVHIATSDLNGNVDATQGRVETIMGHLTFDGGDGVDRMTINDSSDSSAEAGTITSDSLTGFGFGSVTEVQTLTVIGQSGFYRISRGDVNVPWYYIRPGVARPGALGVVLDVRFGAEQVEDQLELIYGFGNVAVTLISDEVGSKTYGIEFTGQLAGADIAPIRWADPGPINLIANGDLGAVNVGGISIPNINSNRAEVVVSRRTSATEDPSGGNTQQFLEIFNADRGTFTITLLDQTTAPLPFDITLEKLIDALQPILNPNNTDPSKPFTNNFDIQDLGGRFLITFKGEHRDLEIKGVDVDVTDLRGGSAIVETRKEGLSYANLEQLDLVLGDGQNVLNVRGTSATTNVDLGGGDDEIYVSSLSDIDFSKRDPSFIGNLDGIRGALNINGGTGDQKLIISDASSVNGDFVSVIDRLPVRGLPGQDLSQLDGNAELYIIGASPAPISIQADQVDGAFRKGFRIETGSGDDTVNITSTISRIRIVDAAAMELDTGLGNDNVFASLTSTGNSPLIIRTEGEFNYRMRLRSGLNIADLTNPEDEIAVIVDGVRLSSDQFRAVIGQNAIDLKIDGDLSPSSVVEAQLLRVTRGRVSEVPGQREYVIDYQLRDGETVKLFSAGQELRQGADYFFYQIRPQQFILVFNGRFNFFRNGDIVWEATRILSEFQTVQSLGQRDDDFVNASGSTLPLSIFTGGGDDVVIGGQGDDIIHSGRGDDIVFGRSGADTILSVEENQLEADFDIVFGDDGIVRFQSVSGVVTIDSRNTGQNRLPSGDYRLLEVVSVNGGTAGDDMITSGRGDDILVGGLGSDQLRSGEGSDVVIGDSGRITFESGHLALIESIDSFDQAGTNDLLKGGNGVNYLIGGLGSDEVLTGFTEVGEYSLILGDLGEIHFDYSPSTGVNSVVGMSSSFPGLGGDDVISSGGSSDWIITGLGFDQVTISSGAFLSLGIGAFSPILGTAVAYLEWTILNSPEDSTGGLLITVDGYSLEENSRPNPYQSGSFDEP
jgi:hypothetical protein